MTAWLQHQSCKQQVRPQQSSVPHFGPTMWLGSHLSRGRCEGLSMQPFSYLCVQLISEPKNNNQVSPILAWVVAANALLQADWIKVSLLKASPYGGGTPLCSSLAIQHTDVIPRLASAASVSSPQAGPPENTFCSWMYDHVQSSALTPGLCSQVALYSWKQGVYVHAYSSISLRVHHLQPFPECCAERVLRVLL